MFIGIAALRYQTGSAKLLFHYTGKRRAFCTASPGSRNKNNIKTGANLTAIGGKSGSDNPSCPVSLYSAAYFFTGRYPYTTNSRTVFQHNRNQCRILIGFSTGISSAKITVAF